MKNIFLLVIFLVLSPLIAVAQCPLPGFTLPATACLDEQIYPENTSSGATDYEWDFCSGDFELTPVTASVASTGLLNRGRSFRMAANTDTTWVGFAIDQAANRLVQFDFGSSPANTPTVTDLGNPDNRLSGAYDFVIVNENGNWYLFVVNSSGNNLIRIDFGSNLLNTNLNTIDLGGFGELNTPNNLTWVKDQSNKYLFISNGGNSTITRIDFGSSILNTPTAASFGITGISGPRGIDLIKDCDRWVGLVTSYGNNKVFYLDFNNGLNQNPTTGELTFFSGYNFPATVSLIYEGSQYYALIQSALGDLYKLSFGTSISDFTGSGQNLGDFGLNDNFANEWVNVGTDWYGFSIEFSNPSTPGAGNLIRYTFPVSCAATPAVSSKAFPSVFYTASGTNLITLTSRNTTGDIGATTQSITISPSTAPQLSAQITGNCLSAPLSFDAQQLSGNITAWNWGFGDGSGTSTQQNATYQYAAAGTYRVKLSVTDANGCNNLYIDTARVYAEPIPAFTVPPGNLCMNNPIAFTNTSTGETGPVVSWTWDFNGEGTSTEKEPSFTFLTPDSKTITLTSSIPGCANVTQQTITIAEAPTTAFSFDNVCNGQATTFTDQTTGNNLTAWNWDFGDGTSATNQNPSHLYASPGKYAVTLTVSNSLGCTTSFADTVYNHALPAVAFTNDLPCSSAPIQFTDQSIVQDANMVAWAWDFGDGNTASERNPQHLYGQTGDFTVKLKAYSQFGCVDSLSSTVSVIQGPEVDFSWDKGCAGEAATFTDLTNSFGLPVTNYTWLIDNKVFSEQNPQYTFARAGTYTIQFSVTTNNLCAQTVSKAIVVEDPPATSFAYFESCDDNTVTFYDTTPPTMATREWRINGTPTATDSVMTTSLTPDTYRISLTTVSTAGCTGVSMQDIGIVGAPVANFTPSTQYGAVPLTVQFSNQSTGADSFFWQFGDADNTTSTETNPVFTYIDLGAYEVRLIAAGGQNCGDTIRQTIEVVEPVHGLAIDAITPLDNGKIALTLTNLGSYSYTQTNTKLIFTLDNGAEITEDFSTTLYPKKSLNYVPDISLGNAGNSKILCATVRYFTANPAISLDKNCLTLNNQPLIAEVYPNPARDYINLAVVLPTPGTVHISLIDRNGAVVLTDTYEAAEQGLNSYTVDTTPYRAGLYIIKIETGGKAKKMKVVVTR